MSNEIKEVPASTKQTLRFKELTVEAFGGINKGTSLFFVIPEDKHFIGFVGDQGTGKSSALAALLCSLGLPIPDNMVNLQESIANSSLAIEKNGITYTAKARKKKGGGASYTLEMTNQDEVKSSVKSPKDTMLNLIGNVFINPMDLKNLDGNKQIAWLRDLMKFGSEQKEFEKGVIGKIKQGETDRAEIGRRNSSVKNTLLTSGYFIWDNDNQCLVSTESLAIAYDKVKDLPAIDELKERLKDAEDGKNEYDRYVVGMESLTNEKLVRENNIAELERKLTEEKEKLSNVTNRIEKGIIYIEAIKHLKEDYAKMQAEYLAFSELKQLETDVKNSDKYLNEYNDGITAWNNQQSYIATLRESHKSFIQAYTPDIEGLEIVTAGAIDNPRPEGLYYAEKPIAMLSESELWGLHVKLLEYFNIRMAIIENISSLGSEAINVLNWFAKEKGGYIAYSQMERGQDSLRVELYETLE